MLGPDAPNSNAALTYQYDADGRVKRRTDPLIHSSSIEYDKAGRTKATTDPLGRRREFVYDANCAAMANRTIVTLEAP